MLGPYVICCDGNGGLLAGGIIVVICRHIINSSREHRFVILVWVIAVDDSTYRSSTRNVRAYHRPGKTP